MRCGSCGRSYNGANPWCPHDDGPEGIRDHTAPTLLGPVEQLRLIIRDRGHDPANFLIWLAGNTIAVAPKPGAADIELPDRLNNYLITQQPLPA